MKSEREDVHRSSLGKRRTQQGPAWEAGRAGQSFGFRGGFQEAGPVNGSIVNPVKAHFD